MVKQLIINYKFQYLLKIRKPLFNKPLLIVAHSKLLLDFNKYLSD